MSFFKKKEKKKENAFECPQFTIFNDCSLIKDLRTLQEEQKKLECEIEKFQKQSFPTSRTYKFLIQIKGAGFSEFIPPYEANYDYILNKAAKYLTKDDIKEIYKELSTIVEEQEKIQGYKIKLDIIKKEIQDIKKQLGIE